MAPAQSGNITQRLSLQHAASWLLALTVLLVIATLSWRAGTDRHRLPDGPIRWQHIDPGTALRDWQWIVIHHSAAEVGSTGGIDRDHRNRGWEGIGYHFVIGNGMPMPIGSIEWTFRWRLQRHGAHVATRDYNQTGIGICLIGNFQEQRPDPLQYARAIDLAAVIIEHIPNLSPEQVIGHGEALGANTDCPGRYLDMDTFRTDLHERLAERGHWLPQHSDF
ncbi:MAG: N-acetylmuramoyl-L-alanine amidase [Planctomycetota bacterium]|nr:MAG: N-acetylmuramoyl-L-alanine amidase [Planctomycetota bacterium]